MTPNYPSESKEVASLKERNKLLKDHIAFLRKRIDEKDSIIEMYSEKIIQMEETIEKEDTSPQFYKIFLN